MKIFKIAIVALFLIFSSLLTRAQKINPKNLKLAQDYKKQLDDEKQLAVESAIQYSFYSPKNSEKIAVEVKEQESYLSLDELIGDLDNCTTFGEHPYMLEGTDVYSFKCKSLIKVENFPISSAEDNNNTAKLDNNQLIVEAQKYYTTNFVAQQNWETMQSYIKAAEDFNTKNILLKAN